MTPAKLLKLGPGVALPVGILAHTVAIVGQKRSGKTSTAVVLTEEADQHGAVFAVISPTPAWNGLRSNAAGDGPGLDVVVMGREGDIPLNADAGEIVARLLIEDGYKVVCNLWGIPRSDQVRFVADFSEAALHLGGQRAVTIIYDEAPRWVPQGGSKLEEHGQRCRMHVTEVVTVGGQLGLGSVLIAQRPSTMHKDVLEQAEVFIAHRLKGNNDRKAVAGWLEEAGHDKGRELLERIPVLRQGQAVVLASEVEPPIAKVCNVRAKHTFDTSDTPEVGAVMLDAPRVRSEIDLGELEARMGHALEQAQENDPETLRRRLAEAERKLKEGRGEPSPEDLAAEFESGWKAGEADARAAAERHVAQIREPLERATEAIAQALVQAGDGQDTEPPQRTSEAAPRRPGGTSNGEVGSGGAPSPQRTPAQVAEGNGDLGPAARKILAAIAERYPLRFSRPQVARLADYAVRGGAFVGGFGELKRAGLIDERSGEVEVTPAGIKRAGVEAPHPPRTRAEALDLWRSVLDPSELKVFDAVVRNGKITKNRLAGATGYTSTGGRFVGIVGVLVRNGLLTRKGEYIDLDPRATEVAG